MAKTGENSLFDTVCHPPPLFKNPGYAPVTGKCVVAEEAKTFEYANIIVKLMTTKQYFKA